MTRRARLSWLARAAVILATLLLSWATRRVPLVELQRIARAQAKRQSRARSRWARS